jgi:hypothetical protein
MTVLVLIVLAVWFVLSAANQIPGPWRGRLGPLSSFSLLPSNSFFAPDPIDVDYHLVFRDMRGSEQIGPWRQIAFESDGWARLFWSTAKRDHQAMLAAVSGLAGVQQLVAPVVDDAESIMQVSLPYLFLLHRVLSEPRTHGADERQFMVVQTSGFCQRRGMELAVLSNYHRFN